MKNNKIMLAFFSILFTILLVIAIIFAIKTNNKNNVPISENNSNIINNNNNETTINNGFELYPSSEGTQDVQIGAYIISNKSKGNVNLCTISFPKNYYIQEGSLVNSEGTEKIEGKVSDLINNKKINLEDKKLRTFKIGTENFNYIEPAPNDTIIRVSVYTDGYRGISNAYEKEINGYTIYGAKSKTSAYPNAISIYIPITKEIYVYVEYSVSPQLESANVKDVVDMFAKNIKFDYKEETTINTNQNSTNEIIENPSINNSNNNLAVTLNNNDYSLPFDCNVLISSYNLNFHGRVSHTLAYRLYNNSGKYASFEITCSDQDVSYYDGSSSFKNNEKSYLLSVSNPDRIAIQGLKICGLDFNSSYEDVKNKMEEITEHSYSSNDSFKSTSKSTFLNEKKIIAYPEINNKTYKIEFEFDSEKQIISMSILLYSN